MWLSQSQFILGGLPTGNRCGAKAIPAAASLAKAVGWGPLRPVRVFPALADEKERHDAVADRFTPVEAFEFI